MARPRISTGTGDDGMTGLLKGERVSKSAIRIHAVGSLDELNAILGVIMAETALSDDLRTALERVQRALFSAGADLASVSSGHQPSAASGGLQPASRLSVLFIRELEEWGLTMERSLPKLSRFILPGGSKIAALLHQARAVCRRAERWVVGMNHEGQTFSLRQG
ncbi:MAG TPA: cob(I)yrinic acid a,c-diamide adenosyltransferase, partial [Candidatus Peribacter riflensis]|nr:cob(I)yrinic acid a,c-diamide adenosyltransferase [Candidatus Peribacter riflensis]